MNKTTQLKEEIEKGCGKKQLGYQICGNPTKNRPIHIFYCNSCKSKLNLIEAELKGRQDALKYTLSIMEMASISRNWELLEKGISQIKEELK